MGKWKGNLYLTLNTEDNGVLDKIESPTEYINAITKLLKLNIIESYKIEL